MKYRAFSLSFAAAVTVAVLSPAGSNTAHAQQASTFQNECTDIQYGTDGAGTPAILATCKAGNGSATRSAVAIRGIENRDGRLTAVGGYSTFQKSCEDMRIDVRDPHVYLTGHCRKKDGSMIDASAIIYDIVYDGGTLRNRVAGHDELTGLEASPVTDTIFPLAGEFSLEQGTKYPSASGNHYLIFQNDGNLVVYTKDDRFVWGLNLVTDKFPNNAVARMQADGNLATYDANNGYIWSARHVVSPAGTKLSLTPSGELQIVSPDAKVLWSSK